MVQFLRNLSGRAEFATIVGVSLAYYVGASVYILVSGVRAADITTAEVLRSISIELAILAVVAFILHARGWTAARLGLKFSWGAALTGIPLFVFYLLFYYITATFILLVFPAARTVWTFQFNMLAPFWLVLIFTVINSVFEEVIVTGYVIEALSGQGAAVAITASTLLRFSYHLYQGPPASISIIPLGLLFGALYWQKRTVWPLMVAHTIANVLTSATASR